MQLLTEEPDPAARIVLGHFIYVYIHPYMDGNGRTGRLLMNVMMAAAGYPWTVIPVQSRAQYMAALEAASVDQNIVPFAEFWRIRSAGPFPKPGSLEGRARGRREPCPVRLVLAPPFLRASPGWAVHG